MVKIEEMLLAARTLSPADRAELIRRLLAESLPDDDERAGERGLASLAESTRHEDWSAHYPASLKNKRKARDASRRSVVGGTSRRRRLSTGGNRLA